MNTALNLFKKKILNNLKSDILVILESPTLIEIDNLIFKKQYKNKNLFFFRT